MFTSKLFGLRRAAASVATRPMPVARLPVARAFSEVRRWERCCESARWWVPHSGCANPRPPWSFFSVLVEAAYRCTDTDPTCGCLVVVVQGQVPPENYEFDELVRTFLEPKDFVEMLAKRRVDFFTGVPDSLLKDFCGYVTDHVPAQNHVITSNEGAAVGLASGYQIASKRYPLVYLQNSGLGNIVNPLLSLADRKVRRANARSRVLVGLA